MAVEATVEARSVLLGNSWLQQRRAALAVFDLDDLCRVCVVPVAMETPDVRLRQRVVAGWDRSLNVSGDLEEPVFWSPVVLSGRRAWSVQKKSISAIDVAHVLDGARRLELLLEKGVERAIPVLVVEGLTEKQELAARVQIRGGQSDRQVERRERVDTSFPRLQVSTEPLLLQIVSDPYVVPTARGYAPALDVIPESGEKHHLLLGAGSLAIPLEGLRLRRGSLVGLHVEVFKTGTAKTSPYSVRAVAL